MNHKMIISSLLAVGLIGFTTIHAGENKCTKEQLTHLGMEVKVYSGYEIINAIYTWKTIHYKNNKLFTEHYLNDEQICY